MNKVLIDRELLERAIYALERAYEPDMLTTRDIAAVLAAPSGTPAMPVKAYYHEAPNEYGGLNKSVGLEVRKEFTDAPLVLESDAMARIACLEGEIAKRDEELAACRVAVENCEVFRARIVELEGLLLDANARLNGPPVSEAKAHGVVQWPEADEIMQMAFEEGQPADDASGYCFELEEFDLFIERLMSEVARLNAAPVQQVSVPDGWRRAVYMAEECLAGCLAAPDIARSLDTETVRKIIAQLQATRFSMLAAAPAAPAADAGIVDMYRHLQKVTPYRFKKIQDASITDGGDVMYFHKDRFDAALLADMAAHRAKGVV